MSKKGKICIDDDQENTLVRDTYRRALIDHGVLPKEEQSKICPTVDGIVDERVPKELRISKAKKKKKEDDDFSPLDWLFKRASKKISVKSKLDKWVDENF